jgi:hypothetical protein
VNSIFIVYTTCESDTYIREYEESNISHSPGFDPDRGTGKDPDDALPAGSYDEFSMGSC